MRKSLVDYTIKRGAVLQPVDPHSFPRQTIEVAVQNMWVEAPGGDRRWRHYKKGDTFTIAMSGRRGRAVNVILRDGECVTTARLFIGTSPDGIVVCGIRNSQTFSGIAANVILQAVEKDEPLPSARSVNSGTRPGRRSVLMPRMMAH